MHDDLANEAIGFDTCTSCGHVAYFGRRFCPSCGSHEVVRRAASGRGVVKAITMVCRAPNPELQALVPYALCLIDSEEGFRLMAVARSGLEIGAEVQVSVRAFHLSRVATAEPRKTN